MTDPTSTATDVLTRVRRSAGWEMAAGALCLVAPLLAGIAVMIVLGAALFVAGARLAWAASSVPKESGGGGSRILEGILLAVVGLYLFIAPMTGLVVATLLLALGLAALGLVRLLAAWALPPMKGRGLHIASGLLTLALGVMLLLDLPFTGRWVLGTYLGVSLLIDGFVRWRFAGAVREAVT